MQRRIAHYLDKKSARIHALLEKKRALLNRLAEKRQALITHAVTHGLDADAPREPSGIDWLGDVPAHRVVADLGYRYDIQLGRMLNAERADGDHGNPTFASTTSSGAGSWSMTSRRWTFRRTLRRATAYRKGIC